MNKDIVLLGALHIALSILYLVAVATIFAVVASQGLFNSNTQALTLGNVISFVVGCFLFLLAIFGIIGGTGIIHQKSWAPMLLLILGCIDLVVVPIGTILGVYTIWIFMRNNNSEPKVRSALICSEKESLNNQKFGYNYSSLSGDYCTTN